MNWKHLKRLWIGSLVFALFSCNPDFLNPDNPGGITDEDVWQDEKLIQMYVNSLYNTRSGYDYLNTLDNITDEGRNNYPQYAPNLILAGQWDQVSNPMDIWGGAYEGIRKANEFFARIDDAPVDEQAKRTMKGEVRFLRAFLYFDLVKRYGGVPLIKHAQSLEEDLEVRRNTLDECFTFIDEELSLAAEELPLSAPRGRASKYAATALRGRAALYYASPFYNDGNDAERWKHAADLNGSIISEGPYGLYPDLNRLWLDKGNNPEAVFEVQYRLPEKQHSWDAGLKPLILANDNAGQLSPLQELVDAFPMKNGKLITESGSGYDPQHPYEGRDDRFYAFIAYNGATLKGTNSGPPVREITLQIYQGGRDYDADPTAKVYNTITGYYTRKAINPENTEYIGGRGSDQPWIEIRYAEVLLNYAEAQNEYLPSPDASVYAAINAIRTRAGITTELTPGSLDKAAMRSLIRNERYVELCFEQKRYWDIRRWDLAEQKLNGKRYTGVFITKETDGSFNYEYIPVDARPNVFTPAMKFMPIPQTEIAKNRNLEQNEGWD